MKVLLSIKPQYAEAILSGRKRYEYRRAIFKRPGVQRVVIYASTPVRRIVGEFCVEEIIEAPPMMLWARTAEGSGLRKSQFEAYFAGKEMGYAIRVHAPVRYASPIDPRAGNATFIPPQSFRYLPSRPQGYPPTTPRR